jgi:aryl-alcohol dehydrogenase-like predicted oxidoreductase
MNEEIDMMKRKLGRSGIEVSALGLGCWAIGGEWFAGDGVTPLGWGSMDDNESIRAVQAAIEAGITLFDTADVYGCGHSEKVLGKAIAGKRDKLVIATKFGSGFDEEKKIALEQQSSPEYIRKAVDASLRRLGTDYIDLYQFHNWGHPVEEAEPVRDELEKLVAAGKIKAYGWSTDIQDKVAFFERGQSCTAAQLEFNLFAGNTTLLKFCEETNLAVLCRSPLAMGLLSEKYNLGTELKGSDIRTTRTEWLAWFKDGKPTPEFIKRRDAATEILTSKGRSLVQGALAWLWGKSGSLIPIPGFKNVKQAVENARAMEYGPLSTDQVTEVEKLVRFDVKFA